jgi:general secretion pathway protein G
MARGIRTGEMMHLGKSVRSFVYAPDARTGRSRSARAQHGFTLLELMIVISIILILIGMAAGMYQKSIQHAREAVLKKDLQTMREAIDNYTLDKQQAPQSLQDLVDGRYLRQVPIDPVSQANDWVLHYGDTVMTPDQTGSGVDDVHSGSDQISSDGSPYSSW